MYTAAVASRLEPARLARIGMWLCTGGAALGALGLTGAIVGSMALRTIVPGQPIMMPNTAMALVLLGVAGVLRQPPAPGALRRTLSVVAALIVIAIGVGTLAEYAFGWDLGIDQLLLPSELGPYPGRPSPPTALALTCLAAALLMFDRRPGATFRPSEWLVLGAALIALTALMGAAFGAGPLYRLSRAPVHGVAVPTAVSLLLTSIGLLLERPSTGLIRVAMSAGPGGILLRRLMVPSIVAPLLIGLLVMRLAEAAGVAELALVVATLASTMTAVGLLVLTVTAVPLNRAHDALQSMQARTRDLVEQAPDGIFVADLTGRYTDVNAAGCHMLGYSHEEIVGKTIADLLPPEDVHRLEASRQHLLGGSVSFDEWRLRRKDGRYIPVEVSAKILGDGRWQGFVRDISERKQLESDLRLAEARSSGILSISADAIISIDERQQITSFNGGAEKIFGYSQADVIGAPLDVLLPERLRAAHREHVARFAAGSVVAGRMGARETGIIGLRKTGQEFPADAAISKLDVAGTRVLTVVLRDITEQKRVEHEQRFLAEIGPALATTLDYEETVSRIAQIAVGTLGDFCIVDLVDEGEMRRVRVVSRDWGNVWICEVLQALPLNDELAEMARSALESTAPILVSHPPIDPIETTAFHSAMVIPLIAHHRHLGAITLLSTTPSRLYGREDVPMAEELAQRAALAIESARLYREAQRALQVRDDVLGIVAHDLRNPLSTILVEARLLRQTAVVTERRSHQPGAAIERAVTRMNRLIQDLLDVTRMEAGRLTIEQARVPAARIAFEAVEAQRALAASASLDLRLDIPDDLPDILADHDRLLQVFENLIGNAIKFTERGSITVGAARREDAVLFWVIDTGPGIPLQDQPHLFDRFWQARAASRHGAGLGLPIVKGIVEAHRGRIWIESAPGQGSAFLFTIPMADAVSHQERASPTPAVQDTSEGSGALL